MLRGIYTASTSMEISMRKMDIFAENVSNAQTIGYKKRTFATHGFKDMMVQVADGSMAPLATGAGLAATDISKKEGILRRTGNPLDLAIKGENGFFQIEMTRPTGEKKMELTRNGRFTLNKENEVITFSGAKVLDVDNNAIKIPRATNVDPNKVKKVNNSIGPDSIEVDEKGVLWDLRNGGRTKIAQFKVVPWQEPEATAAESAEDLAKLLNQYGLEIPKEAQATIKAIDPDAIIQKSKADKTNFREDSNFFEIQQGYIEESNVSLVTEMINLMMTTKNYDMSQKLINTEDKILDKSINEMGRLQ